jgi:8-oxo-dGTP diphosphatase
VSGAVPVEIIAGAILLRAGAVLLGRRSPRKRAYPDCWDVLGGHVEAGETPAEAVAREVMEEAGVAPSGIEAVGRYRVDGSYGSFDFHVFLVRDWDGGEPSIRGEEHTELRWFPLAEAARLPDLAVPEYKQLFSTIGRREG